MSQPAQHPKTPKHVIFLGAGASATSGYPLADGLRQEWLASADGLRKQVIAALGQIHTHYDYEPIVKQFDAWIEPLKGPLKLFRDGGFGTIDEFCYLIRDVGAPAIAELKKALRLVFGTHSPETQFAKSDYYRFIQKLFEPTDLKSLRSDIVVMSFNYDAYLEWLLHRAVRTRLKAVAHDLASYNNTCLKMDSLVTSGFSGGEAGLNTLKTGDGFCLLKLHGLVAWPNSGNELETHLSPHCSFENFFEPDITKRLKFLTSTDIGLTDAPIVFPWEIIDENGTFMPEEKFRLKDEIYNSQGPRFRHGGRIPNDPNLHQIFKAIWVRAREEVQAAKKISFVGLSMHEYLNWGFKFLLSGKAGKIQLAITDKDSAQSSKRVSLGQYDHLSPSARVFKLRDTVCPGMQWNPFEPRQNFEEFIIKEM